MMLLSPPTDWRSLRLAAGLRLLDLAILAEVQPRACARFERGAKMKPVTRRRVERAYRSALFGGPS